MYAIVCLDSELDRIMEGDKIKKGTRKFMASYGGICGGALIRYLLSKYQITSYLDFCFLSSIT